VQTTGAKESTAMGGGLKIANEESSSPSPSSNNKNIIQLELETKLSQSGIVGSFVFNTKGNSVILSLNHAYDQKTVISPINIRQWIRSVDNFIKQLKRKEINKEHID
jgi:hypothetical protein